MAFEQPGVVVSFEAGADLSTRQYHFVKVTGAQTCNAITATTDKPVGVLQNKPGAVGRAATVNVDGISKVVAGAAIAAGSPITFNAAGQAIVATTGLTIHGVAMGSAGALADLVSVLLNLNQTTA